MEENLKQANKHNNVQGSPQLYEGSENALLNSKIHSNVFLIISKFQINLKMYYPSFAQVCTSICETLRLKCAPSKNSGEIPDVRTSLLPVTFRTLSSLSENSDLYIIENKRKRHL